MPRNDATHRSALIEAGHRHIAGLNLEPEQKAVLRAHIIEHRRYSTRTGREYMRTSVFEDVGPVCEVLGMPLREMEVFDGMKGDR